MRLLLDTHVFLWTLAGDPRLGAEVQDLLVDRLNHVAVSLVSLWEIAVKSRAGKLKASVAEADRAIDAQGLSRLGLTVGHLVTVQGLPLHHRDPFDHLLVAQAISEGMLLVTHDKKLEAYPAELLRC